MIGSMASIGFGVWHFFVPQVWKWYSYIASEATELVAAIRAINAFFSLSLILFGLVNSVLIYGDRTNRYSITVILVATCVLWLTRVIFQIIFPQGSQYPGLQFGMLTAFILVFLCYAVALTIVLSQKIGNQNHKDTQLSPFTIAGVDECPEGVHVPRWYSNTENKKHPFECLNIGSGEWTGSPYGDSILSLDGKLDF